MHHLVKPGRLFRSLETNPYQVARSGLGRYHIEETKQDRQVFHSIGREYSSPIQGWQDGHPQSSSAWSS